MADAPRLSETRTLLGLAWPVVLVSLNWTLLQVTDVVVVGLAGTHEVAGFGASRAITFVSLVAAIGMLSGVLVFASQADGAGNKAETGAVLRRGLLLGAVIGFAGLILLYPLAEPLLRVAGVADGVVTVAADVVRIMAFAFPGQMISIAAGNFLEGISHPRRVMVVNLALLPLNAVLAWALTVGALGLPALGANGAALATSIAVTLGAMAMVIACVTLKDATERDTRRLSLAAFREAVPGALALARFGGVPALASGLELAGFSILIGLSSQLGDIANHAFQIVFSVHNVTFAFALGLGSAAGVRAGNAVGEGHPERARARTLIAVRLALMVLGVIAVLLWTGKNLIASQFPANEEAHAIAAMMLAVWAPIILFDGMQVVFMFALRSIGDQIAAGVNGILSFFLITGLVGYAGVAAGWGPLALVAGSGAGMVAAALLNGGRFLWITRQVRPKS
jgi:multidrug resistance protein, MATE family